MARYFYNALKDNKQIIKGEIEASDLREARDKIRQLGFIPTKVYTEYANKVPVNSSDAQIKDPVKKSKITFLSLEEKISFTSELEVLLSSGIPIVEALQTIEINSPKVRLKKVCEDLQNAIMSGLTFAQSIQSLYGDVFGSVYTALVKTGEDAGELEATLQRMLVLLNKQARIKDKIINASIYPAILIIIMLILLILFSTVVFPKFISVFTFNGEQLPFLAGMLVGICSFIMHYWWFVILLLGAVCGACIVLFKNEQFKRKWDDFILKVPAISDFIEYINLSNFMTVLHIAYDAGLPIISGLELSGKTVGNYCIRKKISSALAHVKSGKTLTEAFQRARAIPGALMTMIATGEKSGTLGKMLHDAAEVLDKKVDMALEALTKLFEPAVILIMGGVVLFIALAFYQMYAGMLGSLL